MFSGVVSPLLKNMDRAFAKIVDVYQMLSPKYRLFLEKAPYGMFCWVINFASVCFSSHLRQHLLVKYAYLTKINFLD